MKLKVSVEYSDKTSCFELKLFQNEPKKLSLGCYGQTKKLEAAYASGESPVQTVLNFDKN